jgi:hypothetical protein
MATMLAKTLTRCAVLLGLWACSRTEELGLVLVAPRSPDPFAEVRTLRLTGLVEGSRVELGTYRWDRGPFDARFSLPADLRRVVVEGLDRDGRVRSSAVSGRLDLVLDPPEGSLSLLFTRVGVFSRLDAEVEPGLRALSGRVDGARWFLGGRDPTGCPVRQVEWLDRSGRRRAGPRLPEGVGFAPALLQSETPSGAVLAVARPVGPDCLVEDAWSLVRFDGRQLTTGRWSGPFPEGAAFTALSGGGALIFGGTEAGRVRTEVVEVDGATLERRSRGQLDRPLTDAAAARVPGGRVALIGGRSRLTPDAAVADASLFSLETFSTQGVRVPLARARVGPEVAALRSGAVAVVGGRDADGPVPGLEVLSVAYDPAAAGISEQVFDDLPDLDGPATLFDLDDGSLLVLPQDGSTAHWLQLLPQRQVPVPAPPQPLVGGRLTDGLAVFAGADGGFWAFNGGPQRVLNQRAPRLRMPAKGALGFVPSRPGAWRMEPDGTVVGQVDEALPFDPLVRALLIVSEGPYSEFELAFEADLQGVAAVVFGIDGDDFDQLALLNEPRLIRSPSLRIQGGVDCTGQPTLVPGPRRIRVRRSAGGRRVELNVDDDREVDLRCRVDAPTRGALGIGVISGTIRFTELSFRLP